MLRDWNPILDIEPFEKIHAGHRVVFRPKDALAGPKGRRRKRVIGRVRNLDPNAKTVQVGDWIVPLKKVERLSKDVFADWSKAERRAHEKIVYGALSPEEKKWLRSCAKDARRAFASPIEYSGPADRRFYARVKREREAFMRDRGFKNFTDKEQCEALPLFVARSLKAGITPTLESADYYSADSGAVVIGDTVQIGGTRFKVLAFTDDGMAVLKNSHEIRIPWDRIPKDRYTRPIRRHRAATRHRHKRRASSARPSRRLAALRRGGLKDRITKARRHRSAQRRARWNSRLRWCYCHGRSSLGRFVSLKRRQGRNPPWRWKPWGIRLYVPVRYRLLGRRRWRDRVRRARLRIKRAA